MRKAGILLPIFSLPSNYGIGSLGQEAYNFIDFLVETGQSIWQILPITSTCDEDSYSPYKTNGAFSGNYDLIDIDLLVEDGLLTYEYINSIDVDKYFSNPRYVDYENVRTLKRILLLEATKNYDFLSPDFTDFEKNNDFWLEEYSIYMALREINENKPYWEWSIIKNLSELKLVKNNDLLEKFNSLVKYNKFLQYTFYKQWFRLKKYANDKGIEIFGDIPIYISQDSCDFYFHRELFLTDKNGEPSLIAGVPPDEFSSMGQVWGNPLYNWKYLEDDNFNWWLKRIEKSLELYDILRIDHFRGFESYYCIDKTTRDAMNGYWKKAPGKIFFDLVKENIPNAKIVAEDLGIITDEVIELLEYTGFPGIKIIQFGFGTNSENLNLPHNFHKNTVSYTGTHDNMPLAQWLELAPYGSLEYAKQYLRLETYEKYTEGLIRAVIGSCSDIAIIPIQDWLDFGGWSRMNTPSTTESNWKFRLLKDDINLDLKNYISHITGLYGRYKNR